MYVKNRRIFGKIGFVSGDFERNGTCARYASLSNQSAHTGSLKHIFAFLGVEIHRFKSPVRRMRIHAQTTSETQAYIGRAPFKNVAHVVQIYLNFQNHRRRRQST